MPLERSQEAVLSGMSFSIFFTLLLDSVVVRAIVLVFDFLCFDHCIALGPPADLYHPADQTPVNLVSLVHSFAADLTSKEAIASVASFITARETHLDILISNAGIRRDPPVPCNVLTASLDELQTSMWSSKYSDWEDTFKINVTAHFYLSVALLPLLYAAGNLDLPGGAKGRDEGRGVIVVTSSCASMHNCTNVDLTSYATSKAGTDHLVALLASKFARWYVRVCGINPGCNVPPLLLHAQASPPNSDRMNSILRGLLDVGCK